MSDPAGNPLSELALVGGAWTKVRDYVWLDGRPLSQIEYPTISTSYTYYLHLDHIGLPRAMTNAAGQLIWNTFPRPYGDIAEKTMTDPLSGRVVVTNLRLPGQYDERLLSSLGLQGPYYNQARWYLPGVGRYLELDPLALRGVLNGGLTPDWYNYAGGNPLRFDDPTGLLVTGVYDCKTGQLKLTDIDTGATAQMLAESGGKPYGDPVPDGLWEILERQGKNDFYRLDAWDSSPRDDVYEPNGRDHFRLHRPGRTVGCIAAKDWSGWESVRDLIQSTRTETVTDAYRPWWKFWSSGAPIKKFGNIFVVNCGS